MRKIVVFLVCNFVLFSIATAQSYWQQHVDYLINVALDDVNHELSGDITIEYTNNSPAEINFLYFHLWANAYKNNSTAFAKQEIENKSTAFQFAKDDERGYIDSLNFNVNGAEVKLEYDAEHIDIAKMILNKPLKSGETIIILTPFHVKIPESKFSRLGHSSQAYQITQWYPKPAVYDQYGWHQMPYLNQGEFYSEFGNYTVNITLPANYVVAASGDLQTQSEINFLNTKIEETKRMSTDNKDLSFPASSSVIKTIQYKLENAHDFAWFADKRFHVLGGEVKMPYSERRIKTYAYFTDLEADLWMKSIEYINRAVLNYSEWVGEYQWNVAQALEGALSAGAGMEYPTITIIGASGTGQLLDEVITHEVGHNWFYGMFAFNERKNPWMDEGINSYYEHRYMEKYYPGRTLNAILGGFPVPEELMDTYSLTKATMILNGALEKTNLSQATELPAIDYTSLNYGLAVYMKTAYYMKYLADFLGQNTFDRVMGAFFNEWKMKHPYPEDMQKVFEAETDEDLDWFFNDMLKEERSLDYKVVDIQAGKSSIIVRITNNTDIVAPFPISQMNGDSIVKTDWQRGFTGTQTIYLNRNKNVEVTHVQIDAAGILPEYEKENNTIKTKGLFKRIEPVQLKFLTNISDNPGKTTINYTPVFGWNANDRFMLGLGIYNSTFPMPKFEYVLAPMYAFGSKSLHGQGSVGFNLYPENGFSSRWRISSTFMNYIYYVKSVTDSAEVTTSEYFDFTKIENKIEIDLRRKNLRTAPQQKITVRNILIDEQNPPFLNNVFGDAGIVMINELRYDIIKKKVLFPWSAGATIQAGDGFARLNAEGNFRINYPKSKNGIDVRLFAGKFFSDSLGNYRNAFTLQGANGYQDYVYDEIFFGRNVYDNLWDNQLMMRDGFMKLKNFTGNAALQYSDDVLAAANFEFTIPKLSFIALYADVVYSSASSEIDPALGNIFYDGGVMLRIPNDIFEIYFPLIQSAGFDDETTEVSYKEKITFMFDLNKLNVFEILRGL